MTAKTNEVLLGILIVLMLRGERFRGTAPATNYGPGRGGSGTRDRV